LLDPRRGDDPSDTVLFVNDLPSNSVTPWLPEGRTLVAPGRGELFYRHYQHPDPAAPIVLLLHGWTASADLQFFTAYEALASYCSLLTIDHRGHGRGVRSEHRFELEDVADDAAALIELLEVRPVIAVGYSMGGPVSMLLARRHPHLVRALVVQATALEWCSSLPDRVRWKTMRIIGPLLRSLAYQRWLRHGIRRLLGEGHPLQVYVPWLSGEMRRNDPLAIVQAGQALSRYDARPWAGDLSMPAASLITTRDRLVRPRKQRALAESLGAEIRELAGDHLSAWQHPDEFAAATLALVQSVAARSLTAVF
jgi:pimeloyl-ACP methyl ester carboxylesterase